MEEALDLKAFLDKSPTAFHAAGVISSELDKAGYIKLDESETWEIKRGQGYYVLRDNRAVTAFIPGNKNPAESGLRIAAAHLDSPSFKLKTEGITLQNSVWRLPVEPYGSPVFQSWLDRELEIAGMVTFRNPDNKSGRILAKTWRSTRSMAIIPSLAIHLNKEVNKGVELNAQNHMAALMGERLSESGNPLIEIICNDLGISAENYLSSELYLIPAAKASYLGGQSERLIVSGRLDNLESSHAVLMSLPEFEEVEDSGVVAFWFDAEEIGSKTVSGASSVFPDEIIERVVLSSGGGREELFRCRRQSYLVNIDMAHAIHPNYADRHDASYAPIMGGGPAVKSHGLKHYATDVFSESRILKAAEQADVRIQKFISRSDLPCGSTLGPMSASGLSISTVDIGNPLWGMHSSRETASVSDHFQMIKLLRECWRL